ncbi:MAG TPA: extracellular solute-binding protein [Reyranella sp.]
MRRRLIGLVALALLGAACTAGGGSSGPAATVDTNANHAPLTLTVWSDFSARELGVVTNGLKLATQKYPWLTVKHVGSKDDTAIERAISGGNPPDVAISFTPDNAAKYCQTGAWQDLNPYLQADKVDKNAVWPAGVFSYTSFENKQCALPMLTDAFGLYYNVDLLRKHGLTAPPKTVSELTDMAKKLTEYNPDGSIKVAGFVPLFGFYGSTTPNTVGHAFNAKWYDESLKPTLASDPNWAKMLQWQKSLVDAIGYNKLQKFAASIGGANSEFSPQNGFETGKIAMMLDGEWRNAFIEGDKSKVNYATAPFPVDDAQADLYGAQQVGGTIAGIPKGVKHAAESWLLLKFMTTDTSYLTSLAHGLKNVPSTFESLKDPVLQNDPHFKTFMDIFKNSKSTFKPITPIGIADVDMFLTFATKWQAGKVSDLNAGLAGLDSQIAKQQALG